MYLIFSVNLWNVLHFDYLLLYDWIPKCDTRWCVSKELRRCASESCNFYRAIGFKEETEKRADWATHTCAARSAHFFLSCLKPIAPPGSRNKLRASTSLETHLCDTDYWWDTRGISLQNSAPLRAMCRSGPLAPALWLFSGTSPKPRMAPLP